MLAGSSDSKGLRGLHSTHDVFEIEMKNSADQFQYLKFSNILATASLQEYQFKMTVLQVLQRQSEEIVLSKFLRGCKLYLFCKKNS